MDTTQLQMILTALESLGAEGKGAFIWWLVLDKGLPVIGWLLALCGVLWIARQVIKCHVAGMRAETELMMVKEARERK